MPAKNSSVQSVALTMAPALALIFALTVALGSAPAAARYQVRHQPEHKETEHASKEPFGDIPKGPLQIFVSINQQKLHLYSDGTHVADTSIATGVPSLPTPLGVFSVIQKQIFHRSNIYSNAPMPFMQRITWSGVAIHEGENIGHPASHGCIRMPHDFAIRLYRLTKLGVPVIIGRAELKPVEFADPHLFVHQDKPPDQAAAAPDATAAAVAEPVATAPAAAAPDDSVPTPPAKPADLADGVPAKPTPIAIFISRKEKKIYVRRDFAPLFDAAVTIADPDQPLGTHVFTALEFLGDGQTALRWNVVSLPGAPAKAARNAANEQRYGKHAAGRRRGEPGEKPPGDQPPPQPPAAALARIAVPQEAIDQISRLIVPGSSLIVSDQGLGEETGDGTNFIVVAQ